jgi:hypothetical protein
VVLLLKVLFVVFDEVLLVKFVLIDVLVNKLVEFYAKLPLLAF